MSHPTDTITHGETYRVEAQAFDSEGAPLTIGAGWSYAMRVTIGRIGGTTIAEPALLVVEGKLVATIDTGDSPWQPGIYYLDVRVTDPEGRDKWSPAVNLILEARNTPNS